MNKFTLAYRLGFKNILSVIFFRLQSRFGYFQKILPIQHFSLNAFYCKAQCKQDVFLDDTRGALFLKNQYSYFFSNEPSAISNPPNWFLNVFTNTIWSHNPTQHWSSLSHFPKEGEDIKVIWELSRFYWAVDLATAYKKSQDQSILNVYKTTLLDWCKHNPANAGVNWICGQEVGIRLINFILSLDILEMTYESWIEDFIVMHIKRILPTMHYAYAQCNNHITSECAAILIGCLYLRHQGNIVLKKAEKKAKRYFYAAIKKLILNDGTFAQQSMTYHRMVLDTFTLLSDFQKKYKAPEFKPIFYKQYQKLVNWLWAFTDQTTGIVPNMGPNDGTMLYKLDSADYRDFRPSLARVSSAALTRQHSALTHFSEGGYVLLRDKHAFGVLRYPRYRFRPTQIDSLHFDFTYQGINYCIDSGSYAYNTMQTDFDYFNGPKGHNLIVCDDSPLMRRVSRFLVRDWLKATIAIDKGSVSASYRDCNKHYYQRQITISENQWTIKDCVKNYRSHAVLQWHLNDSDWLLNENHIENAVLKLSFFCNDKPLRMTMEKASQSLYYHTKSMCWLLKAIAHDKDVTFTTVITIK